LGSATIYFHWFGRQHRDLAEAYDRRIPLLAVEGDEAAHHEDVITIPKDNLV